MFDYSTLDDQQLMQRIMAREQLALSDLYRRYAGKMYNLAFYITQEQTAAEEVVQDSFLKVWNQSHQWDVNRGKLITWLLIVTRYTAIDYLRKEKRRAPYAAVEFDDLLNIIGEGDFSDDGESLHLLMGELPPEQEQVIRLAYFAGMSHSQLAEHLKLPLGTIKQRLRLGMQKLRNLWRPDEEM